MTIIPAVSAAIKNYRAPENAFLPGTVSVPLVHEAGCYCRCVVKPGDTVSEGDIIAFPPSGMAGRSCVHSPVPGQVLDVISTMCPDGRYEYAVRIRTAGKFSYLGKKIQPRRAADGISAAEMISSCGVINTFCVTSPVSLGAQLSAAAGKNPVLVVRLFDEDRFGMTDSLISEFFPDEVADGAEIAASAAGSPGIVFALGGKQAGADRFGRNGNTVITVPKSKWTAGLARGLAETFIKQGGRNSTLRLDGDTLFMDASTAFEVHKAVRLGIPSVSRYVHFTGNCLRSSSFLDMRIGMSVMDIVGQTGGFVREPSLIIVNGLVRGKSVRSSDFPVAKYVKSVTFVSKSRITDSHVYSCTGCGNCRAGCPANLYPDMIYRCASGGGEFHAPFRRSALLCIDCGKCNTVCPSRLPLSQSIAVLRKRIMSGENGADGGLN